MMTKYEEIIKEIHTRIEKGSILPGERLPSVRTLSKELRCSINSIVKAYAELEKDHKVYSVPKSGYYLVGSTLAPHDKRSNLIDFSAAGPDRRKMPYRDYQHCMNQAIELYKEEMFQYSEPLGLATLRLQLSKQLQDLQVFAPPERIAVVSGSQQALDLLVSLPFPNGKEKICVEQPTHFSFIESITSRSLDPVCIELTDDGVDLENLEKIFRSMPIKFFTRSPGFIILLDIAIPTLKNKKLYNWRRNMTCTSLRTIIWGIWIHEGRQIPCLLMILLAGLSIRRASQKCFFQD